MLRNKNCSSDIILKGTKVHLSSCNYFTRNGNQYNNTSILQLQEQNTEHLPLAALSMAAFA